MDANNNNNGNNNGQPKMNMPKFNMNWIYFIVIAILIGLYMTGGTDSGQTKKQVPYSKFKDMVAAGYAQKIVVNKNQNELHMFIKPEKVREVFKQSVQQTGAEPFITVEIGSVDQVEQFVSQMRVEKKFTGDYSYENRNSNEVMNFLIYNILPIVVIIGVWIFFMRRMGGGGAGMGGGIFSVGKSKAKMYENGGNLQITFKDVAGQAGAKQDSQGCPARGSSGNG